MGMDTDTFRANYSSWSLWKSTNIEDEVQNTLVKLIEKGRKDGMKMSDKDQDYV